ncbi:hypothetical protein BN8_03141 [Fibrisoma limi BUZ 3]|uniref:Uncharacterized protein n=1 Tax=Fibrisoma limi BUZ 3 TaxID=1185876 RepID=I2GJC8_9BACT|nr:hypothetical protein BN8_03141 [Fibrisoma limi BUZ 3]
MPIEKWGNLPLDVGYQTLNWIRADQLKTPTIQRLIAQVVYKAAT